MTGADEIAASVLAERDAAGLRRRLQWADGPQDTWVELEGRRVLLLCSNNYLGLANDPRLREAAMAAVRDYGVGAGASRLISGSMAVHRRLEERVAAWKHAEAALLFPSGYHANLGTIAALVGRGDAVFSDALNHASIIDGCRLSGAAIHVYPHCDPGALDDLLARAAGRRKLVVTDSVFSMDGDTAPLAEICEVAAKRGAMVMVDEAHAAGVLGPSGAGLVEALGLHDRVDVQMTTLGKALGAAGAVVCARRPVIDLLVNTARSFVYTTAVPPPVAAAALAAVEIAAREPERRRRLAGNAARLRGDLRALGYDVREGSTPIIAVHLGDSAGAMRLSARLLERAAFVQAIRPPTVPPGTARLRVTVMATHTHADLDHAAAAFRVAREA